jgi:hypothetical protein
VRNGDAGVMSENYSVVVVVKGIQRVLSAPANTAPGGCALNGPGRRTVTSPGFPHVTLSTGPVEREGFTSHHPHRESSQPAGVRR